MKFKEIKQKIDGARNQTRFAMIQKEMNRSVIEGDITVPQYNEVFNLLFDEMQVAKSAQKRNWIADDEEFNYRQKEYLKRRNDK